MKTLLFKIFITLTFGLGFYACGTKEVYYNIPKELYTIYKEGDTLIYQSGNKYDTFFYTHLTKLDSERDKKYHEQEIDYYLNNKNYHEFPIPAKIYLFLDHTSIYWLNFLCSIYPPQTFTIPNLTVANKTYSNVFELSNVKSDTNPNYINKVFFNYKYWVIRFIRNDSSTWDLIQH